MVPSATLAGRVDTSSVTWTPTGNPAAGATGSRLPVAGLQNMAVMPSARGAGRVVLEVLCNTIGERPGERAIDVVPSRPLLSAVNEAQPSTTAALQNADRELPVCSPRTERPASHTPTCYPDSHNRVIRRVERRRER